MPRSLVLLAILLVAGCYHPLEIVGEGDIISSTGERDCLFEEQPCQNLVEDDYHVTYTAIPRPGWRFSRWEGCSDQYPQCAFNASSFWVNQFAGQTMPPLRAIFEPLLPDTPNVLVLMADDLGYNDLAVNNVNNAIDTPNLDALAAAGVRFTRHYTSAVRSPSRAAFLTGQWPERLGYLPNGPGLSADVSTMADDLGQLGYRTWYIGKWHMGDLERAAWPDYQGFDDWFGFLNQWRLAGEQEGGEIVPAAPRYADPWLEGSEGPGQFYPGQLETVLTEKALSVLEDLHAGTEPWFLNLWFYAPHHPIEPAEEFAQQYPDTDDGHYRALINQFDHNVGRIVSLLEQTGAIENTIVVFVSDNGGSANRLF